ncbi:MAG: acyl-CoA dehydratase activase [Spirochaetota bacterium]
MLGNKKYYLGLDIGSVAVSTVIIDEHEQLVSRDYRFHHGSIADSVAASLATHPIHTVALVGYTSGSPGVLTHGSQVDDRVAFITAARTRQQNIGSLLIVGGEHFSMIHFDETGAYRRLLTNSSCAAGTGSFLDQQAGRLSLQDSSELSEYARKNIRSGNTTPKIASRCAVFAKTDLIHAQAEGYSLEEICDGLCVGLAKNIADTLTSDEAPPKPIACAGGVSKNNAVLHHLEQLLHTDIEVDPLAHVFGALGAALYVKQNKNTRKHESFALKEIVKQEREQKEFFYPPLALQYSTHPDFSGLLSYRYSSEHCSTAIEVEVYEQLEPGSQSTLLGIDIGSTSTKAALIRPDGEMLAGFYTRTSGKPLNAVKGIFECIENLGDSQQTEFRVLSAASTGSGRKFIGKIIGADLIVDEITAHARAAYELNPEIDTIIEIGGQDSKFTTMKDGRVTFSQMNIICAAGTGSFLEEQAAKLDVPLSEYSDRAEQSPAPLTSDRCTVFMERDINHYLNKNYTVDEILAAALFSVRENYLQKVASSARIGKHVCFQGATAKNRSLVAAFEQKLDQPIYVSKYCHLTGALGAALIASEEAGAAESGFHTGFRGTALHRTDIPIRSETCQLCTNHCRIRIADVRGKEVAFGFLCGRDYNTQHFVDSNRSGFDLLHSYRRTFRLPRQLRQLDKSERTGRPGRSERPNRPNRTVIGLPYALHMVEDMPFWKYFFTTLGFSVVDSRNCSEPIKTGKPLTGAEFCAPMTAYHGHAAYLADKADVIWMPIYLEGREAGGDETRNLKYCYYTQYSSSIVAAVQNRRKSPSSLLPLIKPGAFTHNLLELKRNLQKIDESARLTEIVNAYRKAARFFRTRRNRLYSHYTGENGGDDVEVVLLGRPYTILSPSMNMRIPQIFGAQGVKAYFQDMVPYTPKLFSEDDENEIQPLLDSIHWKYAATIIKSAFTAAKTQNLYPVYITSFKCSPDSFTLDYFERIMEAHNKPYLVLQLDEHDSSVGYETRIEAGVRAFRNHAATVKSGTVDSTRSQRSRVTAELNSDKNEVRRKTLLFPNWDSITNPLLVANLQREGIDARILEENHTLIQQSMRLNSGQCLPVSIIAEEAMQYVRQHGLDPARTAVWMAKAKLACNLPMYPYHIKSLFEAAGGGMQELDVYVGELSHFELSPKVSIQAYFAYMCGGLLRRLGCQIRPYEINQGQTDRCIERSHRELFSAFRGEIPLESTIAAVMDRFDAIPRRPQGTKPKVAIFGDIYVRDNSTFNQDLIHTIEAAGGEVITTPYNEYAKIIASAYFRKWFKEGQYLVWLKNRSLLKAIEMVERRFYSKLQGSYDELNTLNNRESEELLKKFNLRVQHDGESMENILKIFHIIKEQPDTALFVQAVPSFCCPALITEAMNRDIERVTGVPVVSITYDGTGTPQNDRIIPYLAYQEKGNASRV